MIQDAVARELDRPVTAEELRRELERPIGEAEREETMALVRWFTGRYPSAQARLAYVRRAYTRWRPAARH